MCRANHAYLERNIPEAVSLLEEAIKEAPGLHDPFHLLVDCPLDVTTIEVVAANQGTYVRCHCPALDFRVCCMKKN